MIGSSIEVLVDHLEELGFALDGGECRCDSCVGSELASGGVHDVSDHSSEQLIQNYL